MIQDNFIRKTITDGNVTTTGFHSCGLVMEGRNLVIHNIPQDWQMLVGLEHLLAWLYLTPRLLYRPAVCPVWVDWWTDSQPGCSRQLDLTPLSSAMSFICAFLDRQARLLLDRHGWLLNACEVNCSMLGHSIRQSVFWRGLLCGCPLGKVGSEKRVCAISDRLLTRGMVLNWS